MDTKENPFGIVTDDCTYCGMGFFCSETTKERQNILYFTSLCSCTLRHTIGPCPNAIAELDYKPLW